MHIQTLQLARIALESRLKAGKGEVVQLGLEALLTCCWGCYEELQAHEKDAAGSLCA